MKFFDKIKNVVRIGTLLFMLILTVGAMAVFAATDGNGSSSYSFTIIKQVEGLPYPDGMDVQVYLQTNNTFSTITISKTGSGWSGDTNFDLGQLFKDVHIEEVAQTVYINGFDLSTEWDTYTIVNLARHDSRQITAGINSEEGGTVSIEMNFSPGDPDMDYKFYIIYPDKNADWELDDTTITLNRNHPTFELPINMAGTVQIEYQRSISDEYKFQVQASNVNGEPYKYTPGNRIYGPSYEGTGNLHAAMADNLDNYGVGGIVYLPVDGGKIKITKENVKEGSYEFQILRTEVGENDKNRYVADENGTTTFTLNKENNYEVTVDVNQVDGQSYTKYAVCELNNSFCESITLTVDNAKTAETSNGNPNSNPTTMTDGGVMTITNTYTPTAGVLAVSKTVDDPDADPDETYDFKVTLIGDGADAITSGGGTDYGMDFNEGIAEFSLKNGEYKMAVNLPKDLSYTVEEIDSKGYTTTYTTTVGTGNNKTVTSGTGTTATGTILDKTVVDVAFTNSTAKPEPTPPPTSSTGTYKYVHEYYLQNPDGSLTLEGTSSIGSSDSFKLPNSTQYTEADVTKVPEYGAYTYEYFDDAYGTTTGSKTYQETEGKTYVTATSSGNQIIILRYVRTLTGSYHVVHEYYFKDAEGGLTLEGTSDISTVEDLPLDGTEFTENSVLRKPYFGEYTYTYDNAGYGTMTGDEDDPYAPDEAMEYVISTENGEQIIILRYIRELTGTYKYVHEYYYKDKDGNLTLEGTSDIGSSDRIGLPSDSTYNESNVTKVPEYNGKTYTYTEDAYGTTNEEGYDPDAAMEYVVATEDGTEIIILRYVRTEPDGPNDEKPAVGSYRYVHEYYFVDSDGTWEFEGRSDIHDVTGLPLDSTRYYASGVERVTSFEGRVYTHIQDAYGTTDGTTYSPDSAMKYVVTTEDGEQIIILVYIRALNPHTPPPPDLPDPNDPDSPDEFDFFDEDVPLSYLKLWDPEEEEWFWLPEPDIPLAWLDPDPEEEVEEPEDPIPQSSEEPEQPEVPEELEESVIPNTGDNSHTALWGVLAAVSLAGIAVLRYVEHRGKEK